MIFSLISHNYLVVHVLDAPDCFPCVGVLFIQFGLPDVEGEDADEHVPESMVDPKVVSHIIESDVEAIDCANEDDAPFEDILVFESG